MADKKTFRLLKCKAVDDLLYVFELEQGIDYVTKTHSQYTEYIINFNHNNAIDLFDCIKDLNIYIPQISIYLSDYILLKKMPTDKILSIINKLSVDDVFCPYISKQRLIKTRYKRNALFN